MLSIYTSSKAFTSKICKDTRESTSEIDIPILADSILQEIQVVY